MMHGNRLENFLKFAVSGGTSAVLNIAFLYVLVDWLDVWYLPASVIAFVFAMIVHFLMQKWWVFAHHEAEAAHIQFTKFFLAALLNLAVNSAAMYALVTLAGLNYLIAQFIVRIGLAVMNYFLYERLVFIKVPQAE